jgi:hypothetical protein
MDPKTYNRLLDLQKELRSRKSPSGIKPSSSYPGHFKTMKDNVDQAVEILSSQGRTKACFWTQIVSAALGWKARRNRRPERRPSLMMSPTPASSNCRLRRPLGKGARNLEADVETVQRLLQAAAQRPSSQIDPKGVDGKIARPPATSNTVAAIEAFQSRSNISIDGLIDSRQSDVAALLQAAGGT